MAWLMEDMKRRVSEVMESAQQMAASEEGAEPFPSLFAAKMFNYAKDGADAVKSIVVDKTILGEFGREQASFEAKLEAEKVKEGAAPWDDLPDPSLARKQILALSLDTRNLMRDPPADAGLSEDAALAIAATMIKIDPQLAKARFQLVPKQLTEEKFWRNYFYRVYLIRAAMLQKQKTADSTEAAPGTPSPSTSLLSSKTTDADRAQNEKKDAVPEVESTGIPNSGSDEVKEGEGKGKEEEDWEAEILADLNEYELIAGQAGKTDEQWESELNNLLKEDAPSPPAAL